MILIVDYGVGNLTSIQNMLKRAGADARISGDSKDITNSSKLLLPGMGHFDNCMKKLHSSGLLPVLEKKVWADKTPILGICVGLQMLMSSSEEGKESGLGWIEGETIRFDTSKMEIPLKIPNMGWLDVKRVRETDLWQGLEDNRFYFAHSFYVQPENTKDAILTAEYGYTFTVGIERENIKGVQFHPEKSHRFGMQLLKNFAENY